MASRYRKNDVINVEITDLTDLGFGVGRYDGAVVFVADTVPCDIVQARIIKVNSSYLVGRAEKFLHYSPMRTSARCQGGCKSCAYRLIAYSDELSIKEESVRRLFMSNGLSHIKVSDIVASPDEQRYRNKAQYPITKTKDGYAVGFFAPKSHKVTPVDDCPLLPCQFSLICRELIAFFEENALSVYDERTGEGLLRHVYLRRGEASGEVLLTLVINGDSIAAPAALVARITNKFKNVVGILLNVNRDSTNVVLGEKYITLFGRDYIIDTLAGVSLKITAPSFYQVNHGAAELLYSRARELAAPNSSDTLLDLYCGAGSIGLSIASDVREVIGIEIVESAVCCAKENAARNGITNAHFFTGDAKNTESLIKGAERELGKKISPDIIILDPPRAGCDEALVRFTASLNPKKIVYISCNPKTLARDISRFIPLGYNTDEMTPIDLFPCTGHVECVVCLTRRLDVDMHR